MFALRYPTEIVFGAGTTGELGKRVAPMGRKVLIVTGRSAMKKAGVLDLVADDLSIHNLVFEFFSDVEHEPSLATVDRGLELAKKFGSEVVVGIGGGSAMDAAKAIAILATRQGLTREYFYGKLIDGPGLPFVAVPTTAGTGAEITTNSVLTDVAGKLKRSLRHPRMIARLALVDPDLTQYCSPAVTAYAGMDALTQALECFTTVNANPVSDTLALESIRLLFTNLPAAVDRGDDLSARGKVGLGSLMQAMAFSNAGVGAVHALAHPLGAYYGIPHGLACAVLLPHILEYNGPGCAAKMKLIADTLGIENPDLVPRSISQLLTRVGIPGDLGGFGIEESMIPELIQKARLSSSMKQNPRAPRDEELAGLLRRIIGTVS